MTSLSIVQMILSVDIVTIFLPTQCQFCVLYPVDVTHMAGQCLSEETLKAVGPFYLVSMPGEVKNPTSPHWNV